MTVRWVPARRVRLGAPQAVAGGPSGPRPAPPPPAEPDPAQWAAWRDAAEAEGRAAGYTAGYADGLAAGRADAAAEAAPVLQALAAARDRVQAAAATLVDWAAVVQAPYTQAAARALAAAVLDAAWTAEPALWARLVAAVAAAGPAPADQLALGTAAFARWQRAQQLLQAVPPCPVREDGALPPDALVAEQGVARWAWVLAEALDAAWAAVGAEEAPADAG